MPICLWCSYDLTGLPEHHACPECGLEHDPNAQMIKLRPPMGVAGGAVFLVCAPMAAYAFYSDNLRLALVVLAGFIVLTLLARSWHGHARMETLIVDSVGLKYCRRDGRIRSIPWSKSPHVYQEPVIGGLIIATKWFLPKLHIRSSRFGGQAKVREAISFINGCRRLLGQ